MSTTSILSTRGSGGLGVYKFEAGSLKEIVKDPCEIRVFAYSDDGSKFAFCNGCRVIVRDTVERKYIMELEKPKTSKLAFSPTGRILVIWEPYQVTKENPDGSPNLNFYETETGTLIQSFIQRKSENWYPQWSADEVLCIRSITSELHIYKDNDFSKKDTRLVLKDMSQFKLSYTAGQYRIACYVPGTKGGPSFVRCFRYPNCREASQAVTNKSFYKADRVELEWNCRGTELLVLTSVDVSLESYYGEQGLHFLSAGGAGETSMVPLPAKGPVYKVEWQPVTGTHFVVTCGFMPASVAVFNLKCEQIFDFGTGPRNTTYFNPHGNILCLAGFGSLRGDLEVWDFEKKKKIAHIDALDTTQLGWCSDGEHFVTATTAPRLRVNNSFKIWRYTGRQIAEVTISGTQGGAELNEVLWQPHLPLCTAPKLAYTPWTAARASTGNGGGLSQSGTGSGGGGGTYRPPAMRNRSEASIKKIRDDYQPPSNQRGSGVAQTAEPLSKAALKNKKKREAKKKQGDNVQCDDDIASSSQKSNSGLSPAAAQPSHSTGEDVDKDKKIRNVQKKLQQITNLKSQRDSGKTLEVNQIEKIATEAALQKELAALQL